MSHPPAGLLSDIGLSIIFAALAAHLARLLRQPLLLGYVFGGILLGSHIGFGLVTDEASIELISEIGLILLLFIIGLEIDLRDLLRMGRSMLVLGVGQFFLCAALGLLFFGPLGYSIGGGNFDLLYAAVTLALSSTLIVVKLLNDKFEVATAAGRLTVGILVLQDIWAIGFMAFQPNLLNPRFALILKSLGLGALLVACVFLASRFVLAPLFRRIGKSPELVLLSSMAWCFLVCRLAEGAGLSKEMGSLIAGLSIAAFPYGADVVAKLAGIRDFFVTLFFVSLGLKVPLPTAGSVGLSLLVVLFVLVSRFLSIVPLSHLLGVGIRTGSVTAVNLSQISEFSLVIVALGAGYGHVSQGLQTMVLTSMLLASVLSTYLILFNDSLARLAVRLLERLGLRERELSETSSPEAASRDIVMLGCFRVGEALLEQVDRNRPELAKRMLVIDFNPMLQERLEARGYRWVYGDLAHPQTLHHIGIEGASLVFCTLPDIFLKGTSNLELLRHLKHIAPKARVIMTAESAADAQGLIQEGASATVEPSRLAGLGFFELLPPQP